ncbi:hypothetical protein BDFB_014705 [Asbolus verrucosus]|uniref:DNA-directed DNA polymerase n=1 Tax=Asbolus verrucosus TaxID=1661398 RepID=A0A482VJY2_ASBVE|nr:hypothetical protein BDFB_014705 [Asbolus verrucosus]
MKYIDICSLYPTVQCYDDGHATKMFKLSTYNSEWYGLIKCAILPPRNLYHPVLPIRNKYKYKSGVEKLPFPLCGLCAKLNKNICDHTESQRIMREIWCTNEVQKVI